MDKPKVSVVLTTYNRPDRLKKAIESVIKQSFKEWELIVVDDCSPGIETEQVVKSFKDKRIVYHKKDKNFGNHSQPKNDGLRLAKAEYVAYLDDDNEYKTDHLQVLYNEIKKSPKADIVFGERDVVSEEKTPDGKVMPLMQGISLQTVLNSFNKAQNLNPAIAVEQVSQNMMLMFIIQRNYIDTGDVLHKKEIVVDIGGWNEGQPKFADWNLWCRLMKAGYIFKFIPINISIYNMHKDMKSLTVKSKMIQHEGGSYLHPTFFDPVDCDIVLPYLTKVTQPKIAIWTLTWNRLDYTKQMIKSMQKNFKYKYDHYFVDNGSTDGTKKYLESLRENKKSYKAIKDVIFNKDNLGISKANNIALRAIQDASKQKYDIVIKIDNDCEILSPNILKTIAEMYKANHKMIFSPYVEGLIDHPGGGKRIPNLRGRVKDYRVSAAEHMGGIFRAVPAKVFKNWRWPEDDFKHGIQDLIFSQYAISNGYQLQYMDDSRVGHIDSTYEQDKKYPSYAKEKATAKIQRVK